MPRTAATRRWRLLTITAEQTLPDGSVDTWEVQTLQPRSWLRRHRADVGGVLALDSLLDLAEMGVPQGVVGTIVSVAAAPRIERGPGRVVLTTVSHLNNFVFNLTLQNAAGQTDTLGVTGYHKFSDQAEGWQSVVDLTVGDTLLRPGQADRDGGRTQAHRPDYLALSGLAVVRAANPALRAGLWDLRPSGLKTDSNFSLEFW